MTIEHVAVWVHDLERMRVFYETWFSATASAKYENPAKGFASYFLAFDGGARLEIMHRAVADSDARAAFGYAHIAIGLGSREAVDELAATMAAEGVVVESGPRVTGDGSYEAVVLDPEGNRIEIVA
jgi:lactoylglutathione lyase